MAVAHKGSISMGMVLIPIGLYKTTVDNDIHFNQLEKESKTRIKYKKYCSLTNYVNCDIIELFIYQIGGVNNGIFQFYRRENKYK